jgi:hypothetical protein
MLPNSSVTVFGTLLYPALVGSEGLEKARPGTPWWTSGSNRASVGRRGDGVKANGVSP